MRYAETMRARYSERLRNGGAPRDWFTIRNQADEERATVYLYGYIGESFWGDGTSAVDFARKLGAITAPIIDLHINSDGGLVSEGLAIYNALRDHAARVEVKVDGLAASSASWIAQAGDLVTMNRFAQMMIHDGLMITFGNADDHREAADLLDRFSSNIAAIYAARAGGTAASWRAAMKAETWYSAEEAVAAGLADDLVTADDEGGQGENHSERARLVTARARAHNLERVA
jgi:ATP-dependent protease ClpP protease subunit